jgi:hypothetical protein
MNTFYYEASDYAPKANFNHKTGIFELEGVSRPENVSAFYTHLINWLKEFENQYVVPGNIPNNEINISFKLTYCNSASSKYILQMLEIIKSWIRSGITLKINWYYDESDDKMLEDGQDLADAIEYEFNFYPLS